MSAFILRFRGGGPKPDRDVEKIRVASKVTVIDDSSPRMVLVEAPQADIDDLMRSLDDWVAIPEEMTPLPDSRMKVKKQESA